MTHFIEQIRGHGLLDADAARRAEAFINEGRPLEEAVLAADSVGEDTLLKYLADTFELPYIDLEKRAPTKDFSRSSRYGLSSITMSSRSRKSAAPHSSPPAA